MKYMHSVFSKWTFKPAVVKLPVVFCQNQSLMFQNEDIKTGITILQLYYKILYIIILQTNITIFYVMYLSFIIIVIIIIIKRCYYYDYFLI